MAESTDVDFSGLKLTELKARCKDKGLPVSGTKAELIARLTSTDPPPVKRPKKAAPSTLLPPKPVFQHALRTDPLVIKRNTFGNFEHPESRLVFSALTKKVIGVQYGDGTIQPLTVADLERVHQYHFELDPETRVRDEMSPSTLENEDLKEQRLDELVRMVVDVE